MKLKAACGVLIFILAGVTGSAQVPSSIHPEILQVYNFQPHLLSDIEIQQKSAALDRFWSKAKAHAGEYIPALRRELTDFSNPPFFLYDGSMLLLTLSNTPLDQKIALAAMAHCDLRDVQRNDYFYQVHRMAVLGQDTTAAAFHILEDPKFQVFIPQHVLTLGQNYALIYMLFPTDQAYWEGPAIERLKVEKDVTAQKSLLLLIWYAQSDRGDAAIRAFSLDAGKPAESRKYARKLLEGESKLATQGLLEAGTQTQQSLRLKRRKRLQAVSDEALIDFDKMTAALIAKRR